MPRWAAFLRAINVGSRRVTMEALREIVRDAGCSHVETLVASGNLALDSQHEDEPDLVSALQSTLAAALGFEVDVFARSQAELALLVGGIAGRAMEHDDTLYIAFLAEEPSAAVRARLLAVSTADDQLELRGRDLFWTCRTRFSDSPLSGPALERLLGAPTTVRKSTTVIKLAAKLAPGAG